MNDCDIVVIKLNYPKGKCCSVCHNDSEWVYEEKFKEVTINDTIYYVCCSIYKLCIKESIACQKS